MNCLQTKDKLKLNLNRNAAHEIVQERRNWLLSKKQKEDEIIETNNCTKPLFELDENISGCSVVWNVKERHKDGTIMQ